MGPFSSLPPRKVCMGILVPTRTTNQNRAQTGGIPPQAPVNAIAAGNVYPTQRLGAGAARAGIPPPTSKRLDAAVHVHQGGILRLSGVLRSVVQSTTGLADLMLNASP